MGVSGLLDDSCSFRLEKEPTLRVKKINYKPASYCATFILIDMKCVQLTHSSKEFIDSETCYVCKENVDYVECRGERGPTCARYMLLQKRGTSVNKLVLVYT